MSAVTDVKMLAGLLLTAKKIDRAGYTLIQSKLAARERTHHRGRGEAFKGAQALEFIASLKISHADAPAKTISAEDILRVLSLRLRIPFKRLDPLEIDGLIVTNTIPKPFALKHLIVPIYERDGKLHVAMIDPESSETIDAIARISGKTVAPLLAAPADIVKIINEFYGFRSSINRAQTELTAQKIDIGNFEQLNRIASPDQLSSTDEPIKNAVDYLFTSALNLRASDIHIEPKREVSTIRFRIDGALNDVYSVPKGVHQAIASRIKTISRLNIAEKRKPQDGRIRLEIGEDAVELRVSTMPTAFGEKLVLRLLKPETMLRDLEELGFSPNDLIKLERAIALPHGIILVTGPTGSGKTSTLYSALHSIASPQKNIITIEDPIETICDQFNQVSIQPAIDLTFANTLRTVLRQDPDVIMVGEIRDTETADNALQAALTGHLVFSTLHTNDATSAITRLVDLKVKPFLITAGLVCVLAQRLVRVICETCATEFTATREKLHSYGINIKEERVTLREGAGCEECRFTGYYGRTGVYELLEIDDTLREMILKDASPVELRQYAISTGMTTLRDSAIKKVLTGVTTLEEGLKIGHYF